MKSTKSVFNEKEKSYSLLWVLYCYLFTKCWQEEEVLVIKLQFVHSFFSSFSATAVQGHAKIFPKKSRESKNVTHSIVCVNILNPEVDMFKLFCIFFSLFPSNFRKLRKNYIDFFGLSFSGERTETKQYILFKREQTEGDFDISYMFSIKFQGPKNFFRFYSLKFLCLCWPDKLQKKHGKNPRIPKISC